MAAGRDADLGLAVVDFAGVSAGLAAAVSLEAVAGGWGVECYAAVAVADVGAVVAWDAHVCSSFGLGWGVFPWGLPR